MALNLKEQTPTQFAARLRSRYLASSQTECARLATWVLNHIEAGDFTDAQVRGAFGLSSLQYTTLKTKWTTLRTSYLAAIAAVGE